MPDQEIVERGAWLGDYDEIWVYSEFVRRNVNGLVRHYGLAAPPDPGDPSARRLAGRRRAACPGPSAGPSSRWGGSSPAATTSDRTSSSRPSAGWCEAGIEGSGARARRRHPPEPRGQARFHELQELADGLPCTFYPNIGRSDLAALYGRSAVLIHAAGFGVDPDEFPRGSEHFGITPIEAASFGCIPVVYGQGGPREVVRTLGCDTAFATVDECAGIVTALARGSAGSTALSRHLRRAARCSRPQAFQSRVEEALHDLGVL